MERVELALLKAVAARHAAAVVHRVALVVYRACLTVARAHAARLALVSIEGNVEEAEAAHEAKHRAHGADGVAVGAPVPVSQVAHDQKGYSGNDEGRHRLHPHVGVVERIALIVLGNTCQHVVTPAVQGLEQVAHDAAVAAVRGQKGNEATHTADDGQDEQAKHRVAKHALGWRISVGNLALLLGTEALAEPRYHVLHHAHGAYYGAVDAPEEQRQDDEEQNNAHVQRQERWQELNLGHPAEVLMKRPSEIHEQSMNSNVISTKKMTANVSLILRNISLTIELL